MSKRIQLDVDEVFDKVELKVGTPFLKGSGSGTDNYEDLINKPHINNVELVGYVTPSELGLATSSDLTSLQTTVSGHTTQINKNTSNIATNTSAINNLSTTKADKSYVDTQLSAEVSNRENADTGLQSQIDALTSKSDVVDIVGTYAQLQAYDTSTLGNNDIVKVLEDGTHDNAQSYYRWNKTTSQWVYVGSEGTYYTKAESDSRFVPQTRTINGNPLSANVTLAIPSATSELTNDSGFITSSALNGYATETWVQQYIASLDATNTRY